MLLLHVVTSFIMKELVGQLVYIEYMEWTYFIKFSSLTLIIFLIRSSSVDPTDTLSLGGSYIALDDISLLPTSCPHHCKWQIN